MMMMKLDDRDIVCEQDYTPLSNAELVAHIERYAGLMHSTPLSGAEWLDDIIGPARALLARVEAAEARVAELEAELASDAADENQWLDAYIESAAKDGATIKRLMARVAELEAAQQWRPVTEKPEKPGWYSVYDSDGHVFYNADIFPYRVARWTGKWDSAFNGLIDYWCPLPPAPQETE